MSSSWLLVSYWQQSGVRQGCWQVPSLLPLYPLHAHTACLLGLAVYASVSVSHGGLLSQWAAHCMLWLGSACQHPACVACWHEFHANHAALPVVVSLCAGSCLLRLVEAPKRKQEPTLQAYDALF